MPKAKIITALDIGTNSIKALCATKKSEGEKEGLEVLSQLSQPSFGVRRGVVINVDEVSKRIKEVILQLQEEVDQKIEEVFVNINGSHLSLADSKGAVIVSRADQKISQEDVDRVIQAAQAISLPLNWEILDIFPKEFVIDGKEKVKEVLGMQGMRLEAEILILSSFSPYLKNLTNAVLAADLQIADIVPSPLASARACLTPREKELGVALLDLGAGTTTLAIYQEGNLVHLAFFPIGSDHITNDLAVGLKCDIELAQRIKHEFGTCVLTGPNKKEKIELGEGEILTFSHKQLVDIIEARVLEIFGEINKEFKKISLLLPAGIVFTGGGAKIPKIVDLAKKVLKLPAKIGKISKEITGLEEDSLSWSVASGLALRALELEEESLTFGKGLKEKLKKIFEIFIP